MSTLRDMFIPVQLPIIATTTQALATGIYFVTFLLCVRWFAFSDDGGSLRKDLKRPTLVMFAITILLFALSVTDLALSLRYTLLASQGIHSLLYTGTITVRNSWIDIVISVLNSLQDFIETLTPIITDSVMVRESKIGYHHIHDIISDLPLLEGL